MATSRQRVFITGASNGIGLATAELFAERGWRLALNGRDKKRLEAAAKRLEAAHKAEILRVPFDVRDRAAIERACRQKPEAFDPVDVLVNNAGLARGLEPIPEADPEDWDETLDTNVKGLLNVTRAVLPGMVRRGRGHVVNLGSTAGHWVYRGGVVYCASKHAVHVINEGLRLDVHGSGVRVSSIDPGIVDGTNFSVVRFKGDVERARKVYEGVRALTPGDIAEVIGWVVDRPAHVNVQELIVMPTDQAAVGVVHRRTG